jgi:polar amino acid transport system substrate-binding protein
MRSRVAAVAAGLALLTGCGVVDASTGSPLPSGVQRWPGLASAPPYPLPTADQRGCDQDNVTLSVAPPAPFPAPGHMPAGSLMETIRQRGFIRVGVSRDMYGFSSWSLINGRFEGFSIDLVRQIALAVFGGDPAGIDRHITFYPITLAERYAAIGDGTIDLIAAPLAMTCTRRSLVSYTAPYYVTPSTVLSRSRVRGMADLEGRTVCLTTGSLTLGRLRDYQQQHPGVRIRERDELSDCLVDMQGGRADMTAISAVLLRGFQAQDATITGLGPYELATDSYALGVNSGHTEFTRFVNGVLERIRTNGTWDRVCARWAALATDCVRGRPPAPRYAG